VQARSDVYNDVFSASDSHLAQVDRVAMQKVIPELINMVVQPTDKPNLFGCSFEGQRIGGIGEQRVAPWRTRKQIGDRGKISFPALSGMREYLMCAHPECYRPSHIVDRGSGGGRNLCSLARHVKRSK